MSAVRSSSTRSFTAIRFTFPVEAEAERTRAAASARAPRASIFDVIFFQYFIPPTSLAAAAAEPPAPGRSALL